jgi:hypothetical protein
VTSHTDTGSRPQPTAAEPDHGNGRLTQDDLGLHVGVCSCGWQSGGYESREYAYHALAGHQRIERFRPTPRPVPID